MAQVSFTKRLRQVGSCLRHCSSNLSRQESKLDVAAVMERRRPTPGTRASIISQTTNANKKLQEF